jgi:hypothetical protein
MHTQNAASFVPEKRQTMAHALLQKQFDDQDALALYYRFKLDRKQVKRWFNGHAQILQEYINGRLPQQYRGRVKITLGGSYYWKTNHMLSDIDAHVIIDISDAYEYAYVRRSVTSMLYDFYRMQCPQTTTFTRFFEPNLLVFKVFNYSDKLVQDVRMDFGFKTLAEYTTMTRDDGQALDDALGKDRIKRIRYVLAMMYATYHHDIPLKKRIRIVPAWERNS